MSLSNKEKIHEVFKKFFINENQEKFLAIFLDNKKCLINYKILFIGTNNASIAHPREVFMEAIKANASAVVVMHNHPSGNAKASIDDMIIIERLSKNYGKEIEWNGKKYYTFPTVEELKDVGVEDYRKLGTGFRDIRLYETVHMVLDKKVDLEQMQNNPNTLEIREQLLTLSGVGPKVADCILLFSTLKRFEVFPIDVWVRRVMNELYIKNEDETKVNKKEIENLAHEKFGNLAGIAQQYLFYWKREA